jgi:hypothetical protein
MRSFTRPAIIRALLASYIKNGFTSDLIYRTSPDNLEPTGYLTLTELLNYAH